MGYNGIKASIVWGCNEIYPTNTDIWGGVMWYTPWHFNKEHDGTAWNSPMYGFDDGIPFLILPEISAGDWRICTLRGC